VQEAMHEGLNGWQVTDCAVTMTHSGYVGKHGLGHQSFNKSMSSTGADFRGLTPLVLMSALARSGTTVCEPMHRFNLEIPTEMVGTVLPVLSRMRAVPRRQEVRGSTSLLEGEIPADRVHDLQQQLPALTGGEGVLESAFDHYAPIRGPVPSRPRTDHNPLDRKEYLLHVVRRV
jgi:ribosomal protection tetracycline resistance protein